MELHRKVYKALSEVALQMAGERKAISEDAMQAMKEILEKNDTGC